MKVIGTKLEKLLEARKNIAFERDLFLAKEIPLRKADPTFTPAQLKSLKNLQMSHFKIAGMKIERDILSCLIEQEVKDHAKKTALKH